MTEKNLWTRDELVALIDEHYRTLQPQTAPPAPERVEGMQSEVAGLDGVEVKGDPMPSPNPDSGAALMLILEWLARNGYEPVFWAGGIGVWGGGKRWHIDANGVIDTKRPDNDRLGECAVCVPDHVVSQLKALAKVRDKRYDPKPPTVPRGLDVDDEAGALRMYRVFYSAPSPDPYQDWERGGAKGSWIAAYRFARAEGYEQGKAEAIKLAYEEKAARERVERVRDAALNRLRELGESSLDLDRAGGGAKETP
jgi:hypothetical protein